jgi:hypothetical protein
MKIGPRVMPRGEARFLLISPAIQSYINVIEQRRGYPHRHPACAAPLEFIFVYLFLYIKISYLGQVLLSKKTFAGACRGRNIIFIVENSGAGCMDE